MVEGWGLQMQLVALPLGGVKAVMQTGPECPDSGCQYEGSGCSCEKQASAGSVWGWAHGVAQGTTGTPKVLHWPCTGKSVQKP